MEMHESSRAMIKLLTFYRAVPAMYTILTSRPKEVERAKEDLVRGLKQLGYLIEPSDVDSFLKPYKNWIIYTMSDFFFYTSNVMYEDRAKESYLPRMDEEAKLVTNTKPFALNICPTTIIDFGAGRAPYRWCFAAENKSPIKYIAVDKRYPKICNLPHVKGVILTTIARDFTRCDSLLKGLGDLPVAIFMANFLHCLPDSREFFKYIMNVLPNIKVIKILEPTVGEALDFLFDYHMMKHSDGHRFGPYNFLDIEDLLGKAHVSRNKVGEYHEMYTIQL